MSTSITYNELIRQRTLKHQIVTEVFTLEDQYNYNQAIWKNRN